MQISFKLLLPKLLFAGAAALLIAGGVLIYAQSVHSESQGEPKAVLVELFTSEGCSSCPPADALLRQVSGTQSASGQLIVGVSEHVTYWNSLGWADPFSSTVYTDRQNAYGSRFNLDSVYTPQMIINGAHQIVGSDRSGLAEALRGEQNRRSPVSLQIVSQHTTGDTLTVAYSVAGDSASGDADVFVILADDLDQSSVLRGENSGRTLTHVAVARSMGRVAHLKNGPEQTVEVPLPASFRPSSEQSASGRPGSRKHHVIVFAQAAGYGRILAVDQRPLDS